MVWKEGERMVGEGSRNDGRGRKEREWQGKEGERMVGEGRREDVRGRKERGW